MNDDFETHLRKRLRSAEQNIDPHNRSQLAAARSKALEQSVSGFTRLTAAASRPRAWGALATAAFIAIAVTQLYTPPAKLPSAELSVDQQLELYENLEMLEFMELYEDPEFNEWLAMDMPKEMGT